MLEHVVLEEKKKTTASSELVMVKSVCRMHRRRMKFYVHGGLGDVLDYYLLIALLCTLRISKFKSFIHIFLSPFTH